VTAEQILQLKYHKAFTPQVATRI